MALKKYNPTSAGRRFQTSLTFEEITDKRPEKSLTVGMRSTGGRNSQGRVTSRYMGGGHKRLYRIIDFRRDKVGVPARSPRSSTTRTGRRGSRFSTTSTARSVTSSRRTG